MTLGQDAAGEQTNTGGTTADLVISGARILTMDPSFPLASAMAVRGDRILAIGHNEVVLQYAGSATDHIDAFGHTVLPGFIDAHSHPIFDEEAVGVNVGLLRIADVQAALADKAAQTPVGHWVFGVMYDDTIFDDGRPLTRRDIDQVVPDHPVYVLHRGKHTAVVNTKAFEIAGITIDTPDPVGGKFLRENGELTGKVAEQAIYVFREVGKWPAINRDSRKRAATICTQNMAAAGLTSVTDAFGSYDDMTAYQDARDSGDLYTRISLMPKGDGKIYDGLKKSGIRSGFGDAMLSIGAVKFVGADGSASERTMRMSTPYKGRPDDFGILTMTQAEIDEAVDDAVAHGFRVGIHANGDVAIDMVLKAYERVLAQHDGPNPRHRIEHCSLINDDLISRIKLSGVIPAPFYTYIYYHGDKWDDYGQDKMESMFAHRSFLDAGIPVAPASDWTPGPYEPLMAIQSMVTRKDRRGRLWGGSQRISVDQALSVCTNLGAYASFEEQIKGSLTPGKLADFVILEKDPHDVEPEEIVNIRVLRTVLGGRTTYEANT